MDEAELAALHHFDFLKGLQMVIWEHTPARRDGYGRPRTYAFSRETRRMTEDEWARVRGLIKENKLICEPINAQMGFGFGMRIYDAPSFPGTGPRFLLRITGKHLPEPSETRFENGWEAYSPFTHNESNAKALVWCKLGELRDKQFYDY